MKLRIAAITLLISSHFLTPAHAWSEGGHRVIALIAYEKLTPEQRTRALKILRHHPRFQEDFEGAMPATLVQGAESDQQRWLFTQAAAWPDVVRDLPEPLQSLYHRPTWHYINLPVFLDDASKLELEAKLKTNIRLQWKEGSDPTWNNAAQTIDMAMKNLRSSSTSDAQKALMLCWLLHSVGDLHQPLHCVSLFSVHQFPDLKSGDMGGNGIPVAGKNPLRPQTLHSVWDGLLGYGGSINDLRARASRLLLDPKLITLSEKARQITNLAQWVAEGRDAAATYAYTTDVRNQLLDMHTDRLMPVTLPENYMRQAGAIAQERASIAGYRLAGMLGDVLK
ncbi:S1/P1 nuclease [soil metagenome]